MPKLLMEPAKNLVLFVQKNRSMLEGVLAFGSVWPKLMLKFTVSSNRYQSLYGQFGNWDAMNQGFGSLGILARRTRIF